jgi:FAD:protein FMN transferase
MVLGCRSPLPQRAPAAEFIRRSQPLLGTFVVVAAYGTDRSHLDSAATAAFDEIRRVDSLLSIHREDSEAAKINRLAYAQPVEVSPEMFHVVETAQRIAVETDGAFDLTIRPIADLWGFIWKEYRLPSEMELAAVLPKVGYRNVTLDKHSRTVAFNRPGVSLDFGGIGKGCAVDRAIEALQKHGVSNALVRAGGDLRVIGAPPGEDAWSVQIEDPQKTGQRTTIQLRDAAVSTSGNYENFFIVDGKRYAHVLNPRTGMPVEGIASCSVIAKTSMEADAYATALMVLGVDDAEKRFAGRLPVRFVTVDDSGRQKVRSYDFPGGRASPRAGSRRPIAP